MRGSLLLVVVWFCMAESQDGVEPLSLLEIGKPTDVEGSALQSVLSNMQVQNEKMIEKNDKLTAQSAMQKADIRGKLAADQEEMAAESSEEKGSSGVKPMDESQLNPVVKKGLQISDDTAAQNAKLAQELVQAKSREMEMEETNFKNEMTAVKTKIQEKFDSKRLAGGDVVTFKKIPNFMFKTLAKQVVAFNKAECQAVCSAQARCQSFTWEAKKQECWWSVEKIVYDDAYVYAVKDVDGKWPETPGLRWTTPLSKNLYKVSFEQCKEACAKEAVACNAVTYKTSTRTCIRSAEALPTSAHASYYEKQPSQLKRDELKAIRDAQKKIETKFRARETAQKARAKEEEEKRSNELATKRSAREVYTKQLPTKAEELAVKKKVEAQVQQEKLRIQESMVKQQEKEQLADRRADESRKEKSLKTLEAVQSKDAAATLAVHTAAKALRSNQAKVRRVEATAKRVSTNLEDSLAKVSAAHKSALASLDAFKSLEADKAADPQLKDNAKMAVQESHTKLSEAIHVGELSHTKEVAAKKVVFEAVKVEKKLASNLQLAKAQESTQKQQDKAAVESSNKATKKHAISVARNKMDLAKTNFGSLKSKEQAEKSKYATDTANLEVLKMKMRKAQASEKAKLRAQQDTASEINNKAKIALAEMDNQFKAGLASLMETKHNFMSLTSGMEKKTAGLPSEQERIADVKAQLVKASSGNTE